MAQCFKLGLSIAMLLTVRQGNQLIGGVSKNGRGLIVAMWKKYKRGMVYFYLNLPSCAKMAAFL